MNTLNRRNALKAMGGAMGAAASLAAFSRSVSAAADDEAQHVKPAGGAAMDLKIPESLKAEHEELHEELAKAIASGGKTGEAAQSVANILHRHFTKEEEIAMPQLGLLQDVAAGRMDRDMTKAIQLSEQLKADLPQMLKEHQAVVNALDILIDAARQERKPEVVEFAEKLKMHARNEEEVLYPSAIIVGEYLKLKMKK